MTGKQVVTAIREPPQTAQSVDTCRIVHDLAQKPGRDDRLRDMRPSRLGRIGDFHLRIHDLDREEALLRRPGAQAAAHEFGQECGVRRHLGKAGRKVLVVQRLVAQAKLIFLTFNQALPEGRLHGQQACRILLLQLALPDSSPPPRHRRGRLPRQR